MQNVEKRYRRNTVLRVDEFVLRMGDFAVIHGESGSGKSTFLKLLTGVTPPSNGHVLKSAELHSLRVSYIPQAGGLYPNLTVLDNMEIRSRLYGTPLESDVQKKWYVDELGLNDYLHRRVSELSVGYRKMATIACGLCLNPHGLIIDEPFSGLDEQKSGIIRDRLEEMTPKLRFLVVALHEFHDIPFLTKRMELAGGRVVC